jgi:hypothetical protein
VLAEIHGKLSADSVDPIERSEDLLTDAVFGSLRHLPFEKALGALLTRLGVTSSAAELREAEIMLWPQIPLPGWHGKVIEPDVVVVVGRQVVVFEAKLHSPFDTSYPRPGGQPGPGLHQLAVQHRAVAAWARGSRRVLTKVVAVTAGNQRPVSDLAQAASDLAFLDEPTPQLEWLSWHHIGELLDAQVALRRHERLLVDDLLELMELRGVRRVFTGFRMEDYWTVAAAQHVAGDRLYPQIRTFFDELTGVLDEDGIGWSQPSWKGMWLGGTSLSVSKPQEWTRGFVGAQYWPQSWRVRPTAAKHAYGLALYAVFDFLDPALEVGLSIPGPGVAAAQKAWTPHLTGLASDLNQCSGLEVVLDLGDLTRPKQVHDAATIGHDVLAAHCSSMVSTAHLRLRRRLEVNALTVQQAREALHDVRVRVERMPHLWEALKASSHAEGS